MTDAEIAYQIAEERIAKAKASGATVLSLSPDADEAGNIKRSSEKRLAALESVPPTVADLTKLRELFLRRTQVIDLSFLTGLEAIVTLDVGDTPVVDLTPIKNSVSIRELYLNRTQVTDLSSLALLDTIQILDVAGTLVSDISPLARLKAIQRLSLENTYVRDLSPLAQLVAMQWLWLDRSMADLATLVAPGTAWEASNCALVRLDFKDTPLASEGGVLDGLYEEGLSDKDRTAKALALLREARDRKRVPPPRAPQPRPEDYAFDTAPDGRIKLVDTPLGNDADQAALQADLARSAAELAAALAGSNEFGNLADDARRYAELLSRDPGEIGAKLVWSLANRFRAALTAQEAAERDGRLNDLLPPLAKAALDGVVVAGGPWLLDHPGVAEVEAQARAYRALPGDEAEVEAALPVIAGVAANLDLIEPEAVEPAVANAAVYGVGGPLGDLSKGFVKRWTHGFVTFVLRGAWPALKGVAVIASAPLSMLAANIIVTNEVAFRAYIAVTHPTALNAFDKLVEILKMAGL